MSDAFGCAALSMPTWQFSARLAILWQAQQFLRPHGMHVNAQFYLPAKFMDTNFRTFPEIAMRGVMDKPRIAARSCLWEFLSHEPTPVSGHHSEDTGQPG